MKVISMLPYASAIHKYCDQMIDDSIQKPMVATKFNMGVDLKDLIDFPKEKAQLRITARAYAKMCQLVMHSDKEVAAHGVVHRMPIETNRSIFLLSDILVYPQEVTAATVESSDAKYGYWLAKQPDDVFNHLRFQMHSHVNMGVSPSSVDTAFYDKLLQNIQDFYIFLIMNKRNEVWYVIYDVESNICFEVADIDVKIIFSDTEDTDTLKKELEANVEPRVYSVPTCTPPPANPAGAPSFIKNDSRFSDYDKDGYNSYGYNHYGFDRAGHSYREGYHGTTRLNQDCLPPEQKSSETSKKKEGSKPNKRNQW